ncbi:MAG: prolipoprotein diacylglyceryl transferase [Patescibacteria group bacterium]
MYGIVVTLGILISLWLCEKDWQEIDKNPEEMWDLTLIMIVFGIVGARIFHVIDYWEIYSGDYKLIFELWNGGLGIFGAVVGGLLGLVVFSILNRYTFQKVLKILDIVAYGLPLAQFIGRWANYFNNELYGKPTNLPWKVYIPIQNRPIEYLGENFFHPLFLYESLACLLLFFFIYSVKHKVLLKNTNFIDGDLFLMYVSYYGLLRYFLEGLRIVHFEIGAFNVVQVLSIGFAGLSLIALLYRRFRKKAYGTKRIKAT